jgi:oxygen-independent coproporphyrinogen-3 oxidase
MIGLYIHIPFCRQKCFYCDFPSYAGLNYLHKEYSAALCREISAQGKALSSKTVDTVFVGGGTPTILPVELLAEIFKSVQRHFSIAKDAEISMEVNPGTVDSEKLLVLRELGVNRLSFGVQSFNDMLLKSIGRIHTSKQAEEAVGLAKKAGFTNINVDLMYGLPQQTRKDIRDSLNKAVNLGIQHISVYGLKIEENTVFATQQAAGILALPEEAIEEAMYDEINTFLPRKDFKRYEISNYAKANYNSRHNIKYWRYQPYIGLGAAAYSFYNRQRYGNTTDVPQYISALDSGKSPIEFSETLDEANAMAEFVFLALRMTSGLKVADFNAYFGKDFFTYYQGTIKKLTLQQLITANEDNVRLTMLGMKFGNIVFRAFLPD